MPTMPAGIASTRRRLVWRESGFCCAPAHRRFHACRQLQLALVVGTTASFPYIIDWALRVKGQGARLIEVNPEETPLSELADAVYRERGVEALPKLLRF